MSVLSMDALGIARARAQLVLEQNARVVYRAAARREVGDVDLCRVGAAEASRGGG